MCRPSATVATLVEIQVVAQAPQNGGGADHMVVAFLELLVFGGRNRFLKEFDRTINHHDDRAQRWDGDRGAPISLRGLKVTLMLHC